MGRQLHSTAKVRAKITGRRGTDVGRPQNAGWYELETFASGQRRFLVGSADVQALLKAHAPNAVDAALAQLQPQRPLVPIFQHT